MRCFSHQLIFAACCLLCFIAPRTVAAKDQSAGQLTARYGVAAEDRSRPQGTTHSTLHAIHQRGNVMVAGVPYDFAPYSYVGADGELTGFDVDLLEAVAAEWGVQVEFVPVLPADGLAVLAAGTVDVVPVVWPTFDSGKLARAPSKIDFSQPYLTDNWCLLGNIDTASGTPESGTPESGTPESGTPESGTPESGTPGSGTPGLQLHYSIGHISGIGDDERLFDWASDSLFPRAYPGSKPTLARYRESGSAIAALRSQPGHSLLTFERHCRHLQSQTLDPNDPVATLPKMSLSERGTGAQEPMPAVHLVWGLADSTLETRHLFNYTLQKLVHSGDYWRIFRKWFPEQETPAIELLPGYLNETFQTLTTVEIADPHAQSAGSAQNSMELRQSEVHASLGNDYFVGGTLRVGVPFDHPPFGMQLSESTFRASADAGESAQLGTDGKEYHSETSSGPEHAVANLGLAGLDIELTLAIVERINQQQTDFQQTDFQQTDSQQGGHSSLDFIALELVPVSPQTSQALLHQGSLDMVIAAASPSWSNVNDTAFSRPYLRDRIGLLVPSGQDDNNAAPEGTELTNDQGEEAEQALSFDSLAVAALDPTTETHKTIACVVGDQGADVWFTELSRIGADRSEGSSCHDFLPFLELSTALRAVEAGQADGIIGSAELLRYAANQNDGLQLVDEIDASIMYSVAVHREHVLLRRAVDAALLELAIDGTLSSLYEKWHEGEGVATYSGQPMNPGRNALIQSLPNASALFGSADVAGADTTPATPIAAPTAVGRSSLRVGDIVSLSGRGLASKQSQVQEADAQSAGVESAGFESADEDKVAEDGLGETSVELVASASPPPKTLSPAGVQVADVEAVGAESSSIETASAARESPSRAVRFEFDRYVVRAGDTLASIAVTTYGDQSNWLLLYEANRTLIGDDPSLLVEGSVLFVPKPHQP